MSSAERSASRFDPASEGSPEGTSGSVRGRRPASSTAPRPVNHLSTKVEDCPVLVDNRVDSLQRRAYLPTSAPLLRPVDG
jgi:hypothetical protein